VRLSEKQDWVNFKAGGKYYVTRNGSSLVAFSIPEKYRPGNGVGELQLKHVYLLDF
jgi:aspartyl aminopeptidase